MAWSFGSISTDTKVKSLIASDANNQKNFIIDNKFNKNNNDYYLFLIEGFPKSKKLLEVVKSEIQAAGYNNYIIATATNCIFDKDKIKVLKDHMKTFKTDWYNLISYNGVRPKAIMSFGASLYAINKDVDLMVKYFYDTKMNKPYYYLGHGFIGNYDTFIFPVDGIDELYVQSEKSDSIQATWKARFFREQLRNMQGTKELPDDMSDFSITLAEEV